MFAYAVRRGAAASGLLVAALVLAAGCGSGSTKAASPAAPAAQSARAAQPAPQAQRASNAAIAAGTTSLGAVVVDGSGRTLYRFDKDKPGSGNSACNGVCATTWPPAQVSGSPTAGPGVTGVIGSITRADGSGQVTLDGHPLYRFSGDQAAGDTNGDGSGGIWHVVPAGGGSAQATSAGAAGSTATTVPYGSSGY